MRKPHKWISVILAAVLATCSVQIPAYAGEAGSTAKAPIEAAVATEAEEDVEDSGLQEEDRMQEEADQAVALESESPQEENEQPESTEDVAGEENVPVESVDEEELSEDVVEEGSLVSDFEEPATEEAEANSSTESEMMSEEASADRTSEAPLLTDEQIRAFQEHIAVWRSDGRLFVVFDSTEDADIQCNIYPQGADEP